MAPVLGLLQLVLLATACFAVGIALVVAIAYPRLRPRLVMWHPAPRTRILRCLCAAPLTGAGILVGLCLLPSLLGVIWPAADHCLTHHGHVHLCLRHPSASHAGPLGWAVSAAFWGAVAVGSLAGARRALSAASSLREVWRSTRYEPTVGAHLLPSSLPFSAVIGVLRQRIVLSTALAGALPPPLLRVVLAHEAGHVRRRDSAWQLFASIVSVAHLPAVRRQLRADLALAAEEACDEHAAAVTGDRLGVARAILFVERMLTDRARPLPMASGFGGSDVSARVERLLEPPRRVRVRGPRILATALVAMLGALAAHESLHHWTETLLGLLAH